ncbi:MAG TPA: DUF1634 domain-containing protein [Terracidiphilus sp.]|nr:DUF1634 domain-containing protein [Terracidiphilus sp.]
MDDQRLEEIIGQLLRAGVLLAAAVVLAGGVLYLVQHPAGRIDYTTFVAGPESLRTLTGIVKLAAGLDSRGLIQLGLVLLIATPVARVVMAVVGFALEHDRMYVVVSLIVLGVLLFSLMHAT